MTRPYTLPPWTADAIRELIDTLNCLNNGLYESPSDMAECLHSTAESIRLVLDPAEFEPQTADLLNAIAVLYLALQLAANEAHIANVDPMYYANEGHAGTFERWAKNAIEAVEATPGDQTRDMVAGTLVRLRQLTAEVVGAAPHAAVFPALDQPPEPPFPSWIAPVKRSEPSPAMHSLGRAMFGDWYLSPDDTPTAADPVDPYPTEPNEHY
ncbi:hypothetical protein IQ254_10685 [Nodosilinea sp. LEGE 07088]|uniref:hypothetical protein n=1 Tax=Nodosilinea sp. LEGE 07088 TaxID=2777968 RepID=UPI0018801EB3|nr:hypothetical protein [Nodosilinea sp. LEGE 07088]MBE9137675.1 hypothetical protein [Nodosilinea sp. LEGE 07088]